MSFLDKYPRTKSFLEKHPGWTLDQLFEWTEKQLEGENRDESRNDIAL